MIVVITTFGIEDSFLIGSTFGNTEFEQEVLFTTVDEFIRERNLHYITHTIQICSRVNDCKISCFVGVSIIKVRIARLSQCYFDGSAPSCSSFGFDVKRHLSDVLSSHRSQVSFRIDDLNALKGISIITFKGNILTGSVCAIVQRS